MSKAILLCLVLFSSLLCAPGMARACSTQPGSTVELFGALDDPDVLLWDSRETLLLYSAGGSQTRTTLISHAVLNAPGTRARVQTCVADAVALRFGAARDDAVRIVILSGSYRGRSGWVSSYDLRP